MAPTPNHVFANEVIHTGSLMTTTTSPNDHNDHIASASEVAEGSDKLIPSQGFLKAC